MSVTLPIPITEQDPNPNDLDLSPYSFDDAILFVMIIFGFDYPQAYEYVSFQKGFVEDDVVLDEEE